MDTEALPAVLFLQKADFPNYDWINEHTSFMERIGIQTTKHYSAPQDPMYSITQQEAVQAEKNAIDHKIASVAWGIDTGEFGVNQNQAFIHFLNIYVQEMNRISDAPERAYGFAAYDMLINAIQEKTINE